MDVLQLQHPRGCIVTVLTRMTKANPRELVPFRAKGGCGSWPPWAPLEHPASTASWGFSTPSRGPPEQANSKGCPHGVWSHERRCHHNETWKRVKPCFLPHCLLVHLLRAGRPRPVHPDSRGLRLVRAAQESQANPRVQLCPRKKKKGKEGKGRLQ